MVFRNVLSEQFSKYRKLFGKQPDLDSRPTQTPHLSSATPLIWCHVETPAQAHAITSICHRIVDEWGPVQLLFTRAEGCVHWEPYPNDAVLHVAPVTLLPDSKISTELLSERPPSLVIWAGYVRSLTASKWLHDRNIPQIVMDAEAPPAPKGLLSRTRSTRRVMPPGLETVFPASTRAVQYYSNAETLDLKSEHVGHLQPGLIPPSCDEAEREALSSATTSRQIWFASHNAEEEIAIVLAAHRTALRTAHRLLLIVAVPDRAAGEVLHNEAEALGFLTARRSVDRLPSDECQIFIADTNEEPGLWHRISPISFLGQSLKSGLRGVDPCEAAALGSAIIHGPWIGNYRHIYERLGKANAAQIVHHQEGLAKMVGKLMAPDIVAEMAQNAWMIATEGAELSDAMLDTMMDALDRSGTP